MRRRIGSAVRTLAAAGVVVALAAPASAAPYEHAGFGAGVNGIGDRLQIVAYDTIAGGDGTAVYRPYLGSGSFVVDLDCVVVGFIPQHFLYASGSVAGQRFYFGVFDDTRPMGSGPYDAFSVTRTAGTGPCGTSAPYPTNWYPVTTGDFFVGP